MQMPFDRWNPYKPDAWILFIAYEYFRRDLDLVAQYVPLLANTDKPLSKAHCRELFVSALESAAKAAESSRSITSRVRFDILHQLRDLEKAAKRARASIDDLSTAWHRTASRVETLTDLGILEKREPTEKYQYVYRQTELTRRTAESLRQAKTAEEWLDDHFVSIVTGSDPEEEEHKTIPEDELIRHIDKVVRSLSLPTSVLPIDCLALGIVYDRLGRRVPTLGHTRRALESLPIKRPDLARLARGREGTRAEYISLDLKRISEA
jgi:DNA-binding HxlR family transcriptional regulator